MPMETELTDFDPQVIMESGQCFRMRPAGEGAVETVAFGRSVTVRALGNGRFSFDCDPETFERVWRPYFDLDTDYAALLAAAPAEDGPLQRALGYARGLRILRQDPWETLCGFILSQRKHIRAIRACMEALADEYGEPVPGCGRRAFPTPERLAGLSEPQARACGLGYRAPYLLDAAQKIASGRLNPSALAELSDEALRAELLAIHGVGVKVADCVMLFGFRRLARAPVDVWINRVIREDYGGVSPFEGYGPYAGVYQQYLFMLRRDEGRLPGHPTRSIGVKKN